MALSFNELFLSSPQARWTGIAILCAIIAICLSILFNNTDLEVGERFSLISVLILFSIPAILISLFELNCIATQNKSHNWCGYYSWLLFAIIAIHCLLIVISTLMSMVTYSEASNKIVKHKEEMSVDKDKANDVAKNIINNGENIKDKGDKMMMSGNSISGDVMSSDYMGLETFKNKKIEGKKKEILVEPFYGGEFQSI